MNAKTLANFHRFGRVGKIAMTVLLAAAILAAALCLTATVYVSALPRDALTVYVTDHAEFRINDGNFGALWGILSDNLSYTADETTPEGILSEDGSAMTPPENQDIQMHLSFFNQSYAFAKVRSDGSMKIIEAESSPAEYHSTDLVPVLVFLTLLTASAAAALFLLRRLFAVLAECESPFCSELVKRMKAFGFSLLPVALFDTVGETLSTAFLSAGKNSGLQVQWGILVAFAVTMCLVTVFRYGVQLQTESDETL